jgi:hypothetical protein
VLAGLISAGIFWHADRHGSKHATAWGICTFLLAAVAVPVYFVHYLATRRAS